MKPKIALITLLAAASLATLQGCKTEPPKPITMTSIDESFKNGPFEHDKKVKEYVILPGPNHSKLFDIVTEDRHIRGVTGYKVGYFGSRVYNIAFVLDANNQVDSVIQKIEANGEIYGSRMDVENTTLPLVLEDISYTDGQKLLDDLAISATGYAGSFDDAQDHSNSVTERVYGKAATEPASEYEGAENSSSSSGSLKEKWDDFAYDITHMF